MSLHRACCCDGGCITDCCDFWSCSPSTQKTVTLSGSWTITRTCAGGTLTPAEGTWTLSATMTRVGTDCASYRYVATSAQYTYDVKLRTLVHSMTGRCDVANPACYWSHCEGNCQACGPVQWDYCVLTRYNGTVTLNGSTATANLPIQLSGLRPSGAVLTVACTADPCRPGCVAPVLMFTPARPPETGSECSPNGAANLSKSTQGVSTRFCCDTENPYQAGTETVCLPHWAIVGDGCLDAATFDHARPWAAGLGLERCCPWFAPWRFYECNGSDPACVGPDECGEYNYTQKVCNECFDWTSNGFPEPCYRLSTDPNDPPGTLLLAWEPCPAVDCCSHLATDAVSWNLV